MQSSPNKARESQEPGGSNLRTILHSSQSFKARLMPNHLLGIITK